MQHGFSNCVPLISLKCQFYALDQNDVNDCDSASSHFLNCIGDLKNSSTLEKCGSYVYEDEFMAEFGIYSGIIFRNLLFSVNKIE